jgi:hypothetical protein
MATKRIRVDWSRDNGKEGYDSLRSIDAEMVAWDRDGGGGLLEQRWRIRSRDGLVKENPTIRGAVMPMRKRIRGAKIDGWPGADNRDGNEEDQRTKTEMMARKGI